MNPNTEKVESAVIEYVVFASLHGPDAALNKARELAEAFAATRQTVSIIPPGALVKTNPAFFLK